MTDFYFDEHQSFADNCKAFLEAIKTDDPEMAAILRDNWDALGAILQEVDTDLRARRELNTKIAAALDALVAKKSVNPKGNV